MCTSFFFCLDVLQYGPFVLVYQKLPDSILSLVVDEGESEGLAGIVIDTIHDSLRRILEFVFLVFFLVSFTVIAMT